jgi:D-alanyl-D-alanine carboxypeptidase (penicillin-binding protein 5/6)
VNSLRSILIRSVIAGIMIVAMLAAANDAGAQKARRKRGSAAAKQQEPSATLDQVRVLGSGPAPFALDARSVMLVDARTGAVLYAYNEHEKMQPASLAKIMTFYLTLDALRSGKIAKDTQVTISEAAWRLSMDQSVSRMFLPVGSRVSVDELLYGLMVSSGNDAAVALAEHLAGTTDAFAKLMNDKARALGLKDSNFTNPDGLPTENQYTTAADMVKLGLALLRQHPESLNWTSTKEYTFHNIKQRNFNTLMFYDSRVNGIKTGHVKEAGFHVVVSADADAMQLVGAVMGTPNMERRRLEAKKLLDWAYRAYATAKPEWRRAVPAKIAVYGGIADEVAIAPARAPYVTVERGQESKVTVGYAAKSKDVVAPVAKGAAVGELAVTLDGKTIETINVVTKDSIAQGGWFKRMRDRVRRMF